MRKIGLTLCGILAALQATGSFAVEPASDVLLTRKREFRIPFQVDPPEQPDQQPVEIQLYANDTQGREAWPMVDRQPADSGGFVFTAPKDGEYWFAVRTLDRAGRLLPEQVGATEPELKVIVDATPPALELEGMAGQAGEIMLRWQGQDEHLAADRPQIEYRMQNPPDSRWRLVAVNAGMSGAATLPAQQGPIQVRARLGDVAGNVTTLQLLIDSSCRYPIRGMLVEEATPKHIQEGPSERAAEAVASSGPSTAQPYPARTPATSPAMTDVATQPARSPEVDIRYPNSPSMPYPTPRAPSPGDDHLDLFDGLSRAKRAASQASIDRPDNMGIVAHRTEISGVPAGAAVDVVNNSNFVLEYDVSSVGPSGIAKVEMWGTNDNGRTWRLCAVDDDKRSPIEVRVDQEGVYGFKLVVQSGTGRGNQAPQPGEAPQIWVMVDTSKPEASLKSIANVDKGQPGEVMITWEANDRQLAARPVSLMYSNRPGGPWFPIATNIENSGVYRWRADERALRQLQLRLVVKDAAGNATIVDSADALMADQLQPQVQVRSARSAVAPDRGGSMLR